MTAAKRLGYVSVDDYLAGELRSPTKHEYLAGAIYAMAGARNLHNILATRLSGMLYSRLSGQRCQPFNSDTKVRVRLRGSISFYYPDAMIVCEQNDRFDSFQDQPIILFEVLSQSTRRIDEKEKKDAYLSIESLRCYVLVEQETAAIVVYRRTVTGFEPEIYAGLDAVVPFPEAGIDLPLEELYRGLQLTPEPSET